MLTLVFASGVAFVYLQPGVVYRAAMNLERRLAGLHTYEVQLEEGVSVVYTDSGEGEPLLLLHGFTADKDNWTRTARHLTSHYRVIAPDLPGFGDSTRDPALEYSIDKQLDWLGQFIDRLGIEELHLGGSSMGGNIAANFAVRYPERVKSLWLLAPGGVRTAAQSEMEQLLLEGASHPLIPNDREGFERTLDFVFTERPFLPGPLRRFLAREAQSRYELRQKIFVEILNEERTAIEPVLSDTVVGLGVPTLVVWGGGDRVLHPDGAEALAGLLDDAEAEVMEGVGHLPMLERPRQTAQR
ncbi:MAG: alpha/beta hydrolase, partial [Gammaproteobacteria bacterium]|nr:alpha/beta hydrolase [Gammaproteobacteria bacterium]